MPAAVHATTRSRHAIVIGAGPAGLASAEALGLRLERVTLVERDDIPAHGVRGDTASPARRAAALRRVLDAPRIVVRPGLEVVALVVADGRVVGVEVVPRRGGAYEPLTILADLVVDATGWHDDPPARLPEGLTVIGSGRDRGNGDGGAVAAPPSSQALTVAP